MYMQMLNSGNMKEYLHRQASECMNIFLIKINK